MRSVHQDLIQEYMTKSIKKQKSVSKIEPFIDDIFLGENNDADLVGENETIVNDMESTRIKRVKYDTKQKVLSYFIATEICTYPKEKLDPLKTVGRQ